MTSSVRFEHPSGLINLSKSVTYLDSLFCGVDALVLVGFTVATTAVGVVLFRRME